MLLLDSIGELSGLFRFGNVVFMGGTLADRGGHNVLEPASFGSPSSPDPTLKTSALEEHLERRNAILRIATGDQLADAVKLAAADTGLGERARAATAEKTGAAARAADAVLELCDSRVPVDRAAQPAFAFLCVPRARLEDRQRMGPRTQAQKNAAIAGAGDQHRQHHRRGHGQDTDGDRAVARFRRCEAGTADPRRWRLDARYRSPVARRGTGAVRRTGDEPQLCFDTTRAPIGIGADRYEAGSKLLSAAGPEMLFLDDGCSICSCIGISIWC